jgi:DNA-binding response OmpR family regulator
LNRAPGMSSGDSLGKILIVEDDVSIQGFPLKKLLEQNGFSVADIADNVERAVELARTYKPDVVLMDIMLPLTPTDSRDDPEGGIKAAAQIQAFSDAQFIYVTNLTAERELLEKIHATSPQAQFLTKPYTQPQMLASVKLALTNGRGKLMVFVCYAHEDAPYKEELNQQLKSIDEIGIDAWVDTKLKFGDRWRVEIEAAIKRADVAVLLVSKYFNNSRFIKEFELPNLLAAEDSRRLRIIPIYVGPVVEAVIQRIGLDKFQGIGSASNPISLWTLERRDLEAWIPVCNQLMDIESSRHARTQPTIPHR